MELRKAIICAISALVLAITSCSQSGELSIKVTPEEGYAPCGVHFEAILQGHNGNGTSFVWDFGDGSAPAEGREADHVYTRAGVYTATLTVTQGQGKGEKQQASATQVITVASRAPEAALDAYACDEDSTLEVPVASGVLANDRAPDGGAMAAELASAPAHGSVTLAADGGFVYRPAANFFGDDGFTYRARIGEAQSDPVPVLITVNPVNVPPMISTWSPEGKTVFLPVGSSQAFAVEAWDADGEALAYEWKKDGQPMEMDGEAGPAFTYAPTNADGGTRTIEVAVTDPRSGRVSHSWQVTVLGVPEPIGPTGEVTDLFPTLKWEAVDGATGYDVLIRTADGGQVASLSTTGTEATMSAPMPDRQDCSWFVRARKGTDAGNWSAAVGIKLVYPEDVPLPLSPIGAVPTLQPTFSWKAVQGASGYFIAVETAGGGGIANLSATTTNIRMPSALETGRAYRWRVRAVVGDEAGNWCPFLTFVPSSPVAVPAPIEPSGNVNTLLPMFSWNAVDGATGYHVRILTASGATLTTLGSTTTNVRAISALVDGLEYMWTVRALIGAEAGSWSAPLRFTPHSPLCVPVQINPKGTANSLRPTFEWQPVDGATSYQIAVLSDSGTTLTTLGSTTTSTTAITPLTAGASYKWIIRAKAGAEVGSWSGAMTFSIEP